MNPRIDLLWSLAAAVACVAFTSSAGSRIDRHALVTRHNVTLREFDVENPLTVGNGEFAFTVDATGLQTFGEQFTNTIPLGTLWAPNLTPGGSLGRYSNGELARGRSSNRGCGLPDSVPSELP